MIIKVNTVLEEALLQTIYNDIWEKSNDKTNISLKDIKEIFSKYGIEI